MSLDTFKCFAIEHNVSKAKHLRNVSSHVLRPDFLEIHLLLDSSVCKFVREAESKGKSDLLGNVSHAIGATACKMSKCLFTNKKLSRKIVDFRKILMQVHK